MASFGQRGGHLPIWPAKMEPIENDASPYMLTYCFKAMPRHIREYVTLEGITLEALAAV